MESKSAESALSFCGAALRAGGICACDLTERQLIKGRVLESNYTVSQLALTSNSLRPFAHGPEIFCRSAFGIEPGLIDDDAAIFERRLGQCVVNENHSDVVLEP